MGETHECLECADGFYFDFRGICTRICPDGQYPACDGCDTCNDCHPSCATCVAGYKVSCQSCTSAEYTLRIRDKRTQSGECLRNCPKGYFRPTSDDVRCVQCQLECMDCNDRYWCEAEKCPRANPGEIVVPDTEGMKITITDEDWRTCLEPGNCTTPRTDCCKDGYDWYRGMCYGKPGKAAAAIDFQSYLNSGAGKQWDDNDAPQWDPGQLNGR